MLSNYIDKLMQSKQASGPAWFETSDYIRWRPVATEGKLIFLLFVVIFAWIVLSDLFALSFTSMVVAVPILVVLLYIVCFMKGRKV